MPTSPSDTVVVEARDAVCTITFNRPSARNALDRDMAQALDQVFAEAAEDGDTRVVVLRGAGEHFMAGGDVRFFKSVLDSAGDRSRIGEEVERFVQSAHPAVARLRAMRKPVLASVRGATAGFGVSLVLAADLAIAAADAFFTLAYAHLGTSPDGGATYALPRAVGAKRAFEIALLGERLDAPTAAAYGLINRVVPVEALEAETAALAARLADGPTFAYANTKALLNAALERTLEDQLAAEAGSFAACAATEDFAEGVAAFIEKRKPRFRGR